MRLKKPPRRIAFPAPCLPFNVHVAEPPKLAIPGKHSLEFSSLFALNNNSAAFAQVVTPPSLQDVIA